MKFYLRLVTPTQFEQFVDTFCNEDSQVGKVRNDEMVTAVCFVTDVNEVAVQISANLIGTWNVSHSFPTPLLNAILPPTIHALSLVE
jgi:hypothetical protein